MIKFLKKFWYILLLVILIDGFFIYICTKKSNKDITTPGGLSEVESLIEVKNQNVIKGSINTIYVYSIEKATIFQSFIASKDDKTEVTDNDIKFNLNKEENELSGKIQKYQSIEACLICAYNSAMKRNSDIKLSYTYEGLIVYTYEINQKNLKVGDIIYQIKSKNEIYNNSNPKGLYNAYNNLAVGDVIYYKRGNESKEFILEEPLDYYDKKNYFFVYDKYSINYLDAVPSFTLYPSKTSGPSGGLLQTLSVYSQVSGIDYTFGKKIAGTGTITNDGIVGPIGGIEQKVITALRNNADIFICPKSQYQDAYNRWVKLRGHKKMKLIPVSTFDELIERLGEIYA